MSFECHISGFIDIGQDKLQHVSYSHDIAPLVYYCNMLLNLLIITFILNRQFFLTLKLKKRYT